MKTTRKIMMNGNKEFFAVTMWYDGSISEDGPFLRGEDAAAKIAEDEALDREEANNSPYLAD